MTLIMDNKTVSIIIPTFNSSDFIESCLKSISKQDYPDIECIVVDNFSTDKTVDIAKQFTQNVFKSGPERSAQRNFGAKQSNGSYLLFIDSDMELTSKVVSSCVGKMSDSKTKGITISEKSYGNSFWQKAKCLEREFYEGIGWMEGARFYRREAFDAVLGYDERFNGGEDFDISQRVQAKFGVTSIDRVKELILHNEKNTTLLGSCKKKFYYAQKLDLYNESEENKENFKKQGSILSRYQLFFSKPEKLMEKPVLSAAMLFMKTAEFASGGAGYIYGKVLNGLKENRKS